MAQHATLSASSAHRWIACPISVYLTRDVEDSSSEHAQMGTAAHALAEYCLLKGINAHDCNDISGLEHSNYIDDEMRDNVQLYLDYVRATKGKHYIEMRVDYSAYIGQEKGSAFGTSDSVVIEDEGTLHIIDLKYGYGRVDAEENPQLMLYALGAIDQLDYLYDIKKVVLAIVQPRLDAISEWATTPEDLVYWARNTVEPAAEKAIKGEGKPKPGSKQCQWCKIKNECKARAENNLAVAIEGFTSIDDIQENMSLIKQNKLSNAQLSTLLCRLDELRSWVGGIEAEAQERLYRGESIRGYKLVAGRSLRRWDDEEIVEKALREMKIKVGDMMTSPKLKTVAQMEKVLGKEHPIFTAHVIKPEGKPTLARENDKREALAINATEGFEALT